MADLAAGLTSQTEDDQPERESWGSNNQDLRPEDDDEAVAGCSPQDDSTNTARPALVLSRRRHRPAPAPETASHKHDFSVVIPADILARSVLLSASRTGKAVGPGTACSCQCACCQCMLAPCPAA